LYLLNTGFLRRKMFDSMNYKYNFIQEKNKPSLIQFTFNLTKPIINTYYVPNIVPGTGNINVKNDFASSPEARVEMGKSNRKKTIPKSVVQRSHGLL
jgi:hypothetical protein